MLFNGKTFFKSTYACHNCKIEIQMQHVKNALFCLIALSLLHSLSTVIIEEIKPIWASEYWDMNILSASSFFEHVHRSAFVTVVHSRSFSINVYRQGFNFSMYTGCLHVDTAFLLIRCASTILGIWHKAMPSWSDNVLAHDPLFIYPIIQQCGLAKTFNFFS